MLARPKLIGNSNLGTLATGHYPEIGKSWPLLPCDPTSQVAPWSPKHREVRHQYRFVNAAGHCALRADVHAHCPRRYQSDMSVETRPPRSTRC